MICFVDTTTLLNNLNPQQIAAVKHYTGPALVVAGPGSGKTRVLTHRVAYLINEHKIPEINILCVTFTNKAAGEIKSRVTHLLEKNAKLSWGGTFHSICSRILRIDGKHLGLSSSFVIYDTDDQVSVIKAIMKDFGIEAKKFNPKAVLGTISGCKSELVSAEAYQKYAQGYFQKTAAKIYPEYQKRLRDNEAMDFDDLLSETVRLFREVPQVLDKYQKLFKYILIDEYQDTNHAQYTLAKMLAQMHRNLFVVGDMSQAIYSFRGADYRNIMNFEKDYPDSKVYNLEQNYRSTQTILDAATRVISQNTSHIPLELWTDNGAGEKITVFTGRSEKEEAAFVVEQILTGIAGGMTYKQIAVLYRTNAQSRNLEESLISANIPYKIVGGVRFYSRKEIKDIIAYLRVIHNPKDKVSWDRIINVPARGIGKKTQDMLASQGWNLADVEAKTKLPFSNWTAASKEKPTLQIMEEVLEKTGYLGWLDDGTDESKQRIENVKELKTVASRFKELDTFLENVALIESADRTDPENFDAVTLMTIHAAKGLEFKVVFIVGLEEGLFPHSNSMESLEELEEERRLAYVAITRAMSTLYLTNTQSRMYFGSIQTNLPSRFLDEIPPKLLEAKGMFGTGGKIQLEMDEYMGDMEVDRGNFSWE